MRSDAFITVTCDKCGEGETVELCACARNSWDERYVNSHLKGRGWFLDGESDLCETCSEEMKGTGDE